MMPMPTRSGAIDEDKFRINKEQLLMKNSTDVDGEIHHLNQHEIV